MIKGCSVANRLHFIIYSIRAPFSVARLVISSGYYRASFESVIESGVQLVVVSEALNVDTDRGRRKLSVAIDGATGKRSAVPHF
jgi:hypothetical protein